MGARRGHFLSGESVWSVSEKADGKFSSGPEYFLPILQETKLFPIRKSERIIYFLTSSSRHLNHPSKKRIRLIFNIGYFLRKKSDEVGKYGGVNSASCMLLYWEKYLFLFRYIVCSLIFIKQRFWRKKKSAHGLNHYAGEKRMHIKNCLSNSISPLILLHANISK